MALKVCLFSKEEMRFCNACVTVGGILDTFPEWQSWFGETIEKLIEVVKDSLDNKRKNAAILLAKLSKNKQNLEKIREKHGIELLGNVSGLILKN